MAACPLCTGCVAVDPRSHSPHCLGAARPLRWHRARPRGLCLRWGHAGAPAAAVRGGGCPRGFTRAGGSRASVPPRAPPALTVLSRVAGGAIVPSLYPPVLRGPAPPLRGRQRWVDTGPLPWLGHLGALVTVTVTWRAHGQRALAGLPGSVPCSRRHTRCRVSPARGCQPGQGSVVSGQPCLCLSFLRASCGRARWPHGAGCWPRGAGCWPSVARHCPARRGVLRWHRSQSCSGGHGEPTHTPREDWGCHRGETEARGSSWGWWKILEEPT